MANEVVFARQFLAQLDALPTKLSPDHVEDPRNYPARPAYILPRSGKAMSKPAKGRAANPGAERGVAVVLRSLRNPPLDVRLEPLPAATTSALDVKAAAAARTGLPPDKLRLLFRKKPVPDSKTLRELLRDDGADPAAVDSVEFAVMVLGGAVPTAAATTTTTTTTTPEAAAPGGGTGASAAEALRGEEFWADLRGFLQQRLKDEKMADDVSATFRKAWLDKA